MFSKFKKHKSAAPRRQTSDLRAGFSHRGRIRFDAYLKAEVLLPGAAKYRFLTVSSLLKISTVNVEVDFPCGLRIQDPHRRAHRMLQSISIDAARLEQVGS
jgi:hypothetical protein